MFSHTTYKNSNDNNKVSTANSHCFLSAFNIEPMNSDFVTISALVDKYSFDLIINIIDTLITFQFKVVNFGDKDKSYTFFIHCDKSSTNKNVKIRISELNKQQSFFGDFPGFHPLSEILVKNLRDLVHKCIALKNQSDNNEVVESYILRFLPHLGNLSEKLMKIKDEEEFMLRLNKWLKQEIGVIYESLELKMEMKQFIK